MYKTSLIFFAITLIVIGCSLKKSLPSTWHAVHGDGSNSDYSAVKGPRNIILAWQRKFNGTINLGPTHDRSGKIFVTTSAEGCHLYALDPATGETIWCSVEVNKLGVASAALVDERGHLYVADNESMHGFDNSGKLIWETPIQGFPLSAQFISSGRIIFVTHIGLIYVLDKATGEKIIEPVELGIGSRLHPAEFDPIACMRGTQDCPCANTVAVDIKSGKFFFTYWEPGSKQADCLAMQYSGTPKPTISTIWRNGSLPGGSASSPDISFDGKRIYVNDNNGGLHAIDAETGRNIWMFDIGYAPGGSQSTSPDGIIVPAGGPMAPLLCIQDNGDQPKLLWRRDSTFNRGIATQAAGELIYATVADRNRGRFYNRLAVIEAKSGKQIDDEELPGITLFTVGTTIGPEGNVYVSTFNGKLFAFRPDR